MSDKLPPRPRTFPAFWIDVAAREVVRAFNRRLRPYGLSYMHFFLLLLLWEEDGQRPGTLAGELRLDSSSLTGHLDRMEQAGLLIRKPDHDDGRVVRVFLGERGQQLRAELAGLAADLGSWASDGVASEGGGIQRTLEALVRRLEREERGGGQAQRQRLRVGIDVGGTFTDLVALDELTGTLVKLKVPTTPQTPERGVLNALTQFLDGIPSGAELSLISHSTTIATNALLGQIHLELPRVALVTTEGFRDVIEIGRQNRSEIYNILVRRPAPLVARADRLVVRERIDAYGRVVTPLDESALGGLIEELRRREVRSVAVGLLNSYVDDRHERAVCRAIRAALPGVHVSLSSELDAEYREYERLSTAVVNAVLAPLTQTYLEGLESGVRAQGIEAPLYVMQSNGGMASIDAVSQRPATLIESGPASGVIGAAFIGKKLGIDNVLSFDMGGTTAKAGTIIGGEPEIVGEFEAAGRTHSGRSVRGSGYPVRFPFVDLAEVSAGGGTIAWIDAASALRVGPLSAGADPGPACYGRGDQPTVTDANVLLGRINPRYLLGGRFPIHAQRAQRAIATLAERLGGISAEQVAAGIVKLVDSEMAKILRIVSIERGYDPRSFTMMAFGGGGPIHACALAEELEVPRILIPPDPGLFSAYGLLAADLRSTYVQSIIATPDTLDPGTLETVFARMEERGHASLRSQGVRAESVAFVREYDIRYLGQSFELAVPFKPALDESIETFHERHRRTYGYASPGESVEIVNARLIAIGRVPKPPVSVSAALEDTQPHPDALLEERPVWFGSSYVPAPVWRRELLSSGNRIAGPAVIEQYDSCTVVPPCWRCRVDTLGNLSLERTDA